MTDVPGRRPAIRISTEEGPIDVPVASLVAEGGLIAGGAETVDRRGDALPVGAILETELPWVTVSSADESYRATIPTEQLLRDGLLLVGTASEPLSDDEGGPVRLVVADGDTLCWNVKGVASLQATAEPIPDSVPENPTH